MWEKVALAFLGAVVGWFLQQYRVARSEDVALINEHIKDIEKFCEAAQAYWLKKYDKLEEDQAAAAKVRAAHAATTLLYSQMLTICGDKSQEYSDHSITLFTTATGGTFETLNRDFDPELAVRVFDQTAQLIHLLRLLRRDVLSLSRLWVDFRSRL